MKNSEGFVRFDWPNDMSGGREKGLAGCLRLRDEETWCGLAIESFIDWLDELVIVVQPSADRTRDIVEKYRGGRVVVYDYPFLTKPNGPGHDKLPEDSVHTPSYYYNFALSKTTRTHVVKLDGDMVMMDWAGESIRDAMRKYDRVRFHGINIVGDELRHIGSHPRCTTDGVFKVTPETRYYPGEKSERLACPPAEFEIRPPAFLHFKFARKPIESVTKAWPENWSEISHFREIFKRRLPVGNYEGGYPESVRVLLDARSE